MPKTDDKIDLVKELKPLYAPPRGKFVLVDVPQLSFLMIDGKGDPNRVPAYAQAIEALYSVAFTAKFMMKLGPKKIDFRVMPLEGLWWADDMSDFAAAKRDRWKWTAMMAVPAAVTAKVLAEAKAKAAERKSLPALPLLRLEVFREGRAAQTMFVGPWSEEGPTIAALHRFIEESGHRLAGKHHEIYLSDPRRTTPAKLRTIVRQPFA